MKSFTKIFAAVLIFLSFQLAQGQNPNSKGFDLMGKNPETILVNQTFTNNSEILPFEGKVSTIFGLAVKANISFNDENSSVRIILIDKLGDEYLVYETYPLMEESSSFSVDNVSEETGILNGLKPQSLKIEVKNASLSLVSITYSSASDQGIDAQKVKKEKKQLQNNSKINRINKTIKAKGYAWVAGETEVAALSYAEKKKLYGQSKLPAGAEYYVGGIISAGDGVTLKSATASVMVDNWDWRSRHNKNWVTSVKNQGACGSCWAFAVTGVAEAQVNLFYNQPLNLDLSEQNILSCSGAGSCSGGYPSIALDYIKNTGIIDEVAFPYNATNNVCTNKSSSPTEQIKIGGRVDFGSATYSVSEDNLKKMIIKYGPISGGLLDWSHAMTLVGWQVVKEGDRFYYRDLNRYTYFYTIPAGSPLIGKTVWIFKNSYGSAWGDAGYVYVETSISNFAWTHGVVASVQSMKQNYTVQCVDADGDGYYWWGLGAKPTGAPACPDTPDGNDADATLGPLDEFGNCIPLNTAPVADFAADQNIVNENATIKFTDLSMNAPATWAWTFDGGTPATSNSANPSVTYKASGKYNVTLVVTNAHGNSTKIKTGYVTINTYTPAYCSSKGNASSEWIAQASLNGSTYATTSTGVAGYADLTSKAFNVEVGKSYSLTLTPGYKKANFWYWSVWIDLNHDYDFDDAGEQIVTMSKSKTTFTKSITIPATAMTGATRMRVSMKRGSFPLPCEIFSYGEVKDFTVNISAPSAATVLKSATTEKPSIASVLNLTVFPNPAERAINLKLNDFFGNEVYSIYNMQGALIKTEKLESNLAQIDVTGLTSGVYVIKVKSGETMLQEKFIKR